MDFKQLQSFVAVVKYKSFTKAAEKLYISQPTISTHIRLLEEELNTRLIVRSTKSFDITERGMELFGAAENILQIKDNLIKQWNNEEEHIIQIAASTLPSTYILPEILPSYSKDNANTFFVIEQGDSENVVKLVSEGKCQIGLLGMEPGQKGLECTPFYEDKMVIITPVNDYYLKKYYSKVRKGEEIDFFQLLSEPIIVRENGSGTQKHANLLFEQINVVEEDLNITARLNDPESIKNLVASGLGISVISKKAAENYAKENRLLVYDLPFQAASRKLYLIHRKDEILKNYVKDFIQFVVNYYK